MMKEERIELPDPRNNDIQVWVGDQLYQRNDAKVSVFDSVVQGGDAVWEGIRVYDGRVFKLDEHVNRLLASAHALAFTDIPTREFVHNALFATLEANGMRDGAHVRLTLTRGKKTTSGMSPHFNVYGPCLIVLAEWKRPVYDKAGIDASKNGVRLITSAIRRNSPAFLDSKIHHANLLNNILAKIQANVAGVDDALMLDANGFASETNATNVFFIKGNSVLTPHADACLPGITRATVIKLVRANDIPLLERNISIAEVYSCDEMFTTGTMGELTPVLEVDGRIIGSGVVGPMTQRIQKIFRDVTEVEGTPLPF